MHHAFLLLGTYSECLPLIPIEDQQTGPDVFQYETDSFTIDDARTLKARSYEKPVENAYRVFILSFRSVTVEAQNALLKLMEDPTGQVKFYLITEHAHSIIPTLHSRLMGISVPTKEPEDIGEQVLLFLKSSYSERLELIAERMKEKDVLWSEAVCNGLEIWVEKEQRLESMRDVAFVRKYERARSASRKMLLEHLALSLPVL